MSRLRLFEWQQAAVTTKVLFKEKKYKQCVKYCEDELKGAQKASRGALSVAE